MDVSSDQLLQLFWTRLCASAAPLPTWCWNVPLSRWGVGSVSLYVALRDLLSTHTRSILWDSVWFCWLLLYCHSCINSFFCAYVLHIEELGRRGIIKHLWIYKAFIKRLCHLQLIWGRICLQGRMLVGYIQSLAGYQTDGLGFLLAVAQGHPHRVTKGLMTLIWWHAACFLKASKEVRVLARDTL